MIGQGKEAARRALEADKELAARIYADITGESADVKKDSKAAEPKKSADDLDTVEK